MRSTHLFNHDWLFIPQKVAGNMPDSAFERVILPHTNKLVPHRNFDDADYQFISTYRKHFTLPEPLNGRRLLLDFDGAMMGTTVTLNGHTFPEHKGGYVPFSFDITDYVQENGDNLLEVSLDSTERPDIPPFGFMVDYLAFGGIYRDVHLRYVAPCYIEKTRIRTHDVLTAHAYAEVDVWIKNTTDIPHKVYISAEFDGEWDAEFASSTELVIPAKSLMKRTLTLPKGTFDLWSMDNPVLYTCVVDLGVEAPNTPMVLVDQIRTRFGFREAQFRADGFFLNGERVKLRGLNRHQTYPYIGAAASARLQQKDADIVKYELGCNIVRTSHYPQSTYFLNRCDEIGLLVFEEIPGWQHIGDDAWKLVAKNDLRVMIERDWNHPSIIIWGVRINESQDDHDFYCDTNTLARELDNTRPTGGVRYLSDSEFLEDVYTMNDFSNGIIEPTYSPWLVTEFNGHMYPTKSYDGEERKIEHAMRHVKVQNLAGANEKVSGAIGWCAFDYNTHVQFGAGDRICYHGVMDIFRLPKYAAHFYASQISPAVRVVLQACSSWQPGDISEGLLNAIWVFSNCEQVTAYVGDEKIGTFSPDTQKFPHLPHPPFNIDGLGVMVARPNGDLRLEGLIGGQIVATQRISTDTLPKKLTITPDDTELTADGIDMTRVVIQIEDTFGNPLPFATYAVAFEVHGEATLYGENPLVLMGGQGAVYVRSKQTAGTVKLVAKADKFTADCVITLK
ncbi:MAG: glycoside hydrolase family 2 TIM barrel-domain containing protein [Phototrophicales bacterium]|nr:glycoside hydrolase family 2 TIM barrel-domain containing protein [Phototrophicales bacterium]